MSPNTCEGCPRSTHRWSAHTVSFDAGYAAASSSSWATAALRRLSFWPLRGRTQRHTATARRGPLPTGSAPQRGPAREATRERRASAEAQRAPGRPFYQVAKGEGHLTVQPQGKASRSGHRHGCVVSLGKASGSVPVGAGPRSGGRSRFKRRPMHRPEGRSDGHLALVCAALVYAEMSAYSARRPEARSLCPAAGTRSPRASAGPAPS